MKSLIISYLTIIPWLISCQSNSALTPEQIDYRTRNIVREESLSAYEDIRQEVLHSIKQTIRNEIVPEFREVSLLNRKVSQKQKLAKGASMKKIVIGRVEWISTVAPKASYRARVDTGAQTCSLHAEQIKEVEKEGKKYVEFVSTDDTGNKHVYLKEVVRETKVKNTSGKAEKRFVVKMDLNFGGRDLTVNVNLNNRSNLRHNFLIGRNLLLGDYVVDVSQSRLMEEK